MNAPDPGPSQSRGIQEYAVKMEKDVPAPMRDGTILRADILRPDSQGSFPVLLRRTAYGKGGNSGLDLARAVRTGYVVITQDIRGRYASDGEFQPLFLERQTEAEDGYDTVEWAAKLPYCNGKVGTFGCSYDAFTQWELATKRPPHLTAMLPGGMSTRSTDWEKGGILRTGRALNWVTAALAPDTIRRLGGPKPWTSEEGQKTWEMDRGKWIWYLPLNDIPDAVLGGLSNQFREWLPKQNVDVWRFQEKHPEIAVPVLHYTSWYDRLIGTIDQYSGMQKNGRSEKAKKHQKLLIGPWSHCGVSDGIADFEGGRYIGDADFGPGAVMNFTDFTLRWFDYWLKGVDDGISGEPPVRIFTMGANKWRFENEWPLARTQLITYYIHSGGHANGPLGDGQLDRSPPQLSESFDSYIYDPKDPVMSLYLPIMQDAPRDQRLLDVRRDVLVFASAPLSEELEVTGTATVKLQAATSAKDTDFTAKLVDVDPSGFSLNLCYGVIRGRYRESLEKPKLLTPNHVYEFTIEMQPTSNLFKIGHRIRLDVSSSDFPNFDRNHNTGGDDWKDSVLIQANQKVFHDQKLQSKLILPIIPPSKV